MQNHPPSEAKKILRHFATPFVHWYDAAKTVGQPKTFPDYVNEKRIVSLKNIEIITSSALLSALFAYPADRSTSFTISDIPLVQDLLLSAFLILIYTGVGAINHIPMRVVGGTGRFKETVIAGIFVGSVLTPFQSMITSGAIVLGLNDESIPQAINAGAMGIYVPLYREIHKIKGRQLFLAIVITIAAISPFVFIFFMLTDVSTH
ncbi:MAG: hypothetical protein AAF328_03390 [Planctomycetota bacterium]